jgi:NADH-quinone oxidoreductase subunit E
MHTATESKPQELLSDEIRAQIDRETAKYPPERKGAAVMAALRIVQDERGWLAPESIEAVALYLGIPPLRALEVATFYSMYNLAPVGKYKIDVCTNISCLLCGSDKIMAHLQGTLGIKPGETTKDGKFTLKEVECLGACVNAPMLQIGTEFHENLTPAKVDEILKGLK